METVITNCLAYVDHGLAPDLPVEEEPPSPSSVPSRRGARRGSITLTDPTPTKTDTGFRLNVLDESTSVLGRGFHAAQARTKASWSKEDLYWRMGREAKPEWAPHLNHARPGDFAFDGGVVKLSTKTHWKRPHSAPMRGAREWKPSRDELNSAPSRRLALVVQTMCTRKLQREFAHLVVLRRPPQRVERLFAALMRFLLPGGAIYVQSMTAYR